MLRTTYRYISRLIDDIAIASTVITEQRRGFSKTGDGRPPCYDELVAAMIESPPELSWPEQRRRHRVPIRIPGLGRESFCDLRPGGAEADTLVVYHHGLGEIPHGALPGILRRYPGLSARCDWVFMKALYHESHATISRDLLSDRDALVHTLAASAGMAKSIARAAQATGRYRHLVMCGVSMGGVVSLIESVMEPAFNLYMPLLAGPDLADVIINSRLAKALHGASRRREAKAPWLSEFDVTTYVKPGDPRPIRGLLARSDRLFRHAVQVEAYARMPRCEVSTFEGGHITGAVSAPVLARHLRRNIRTELWERAPAASS